MTPSLFIALLFVAVLLVYLAIAARTWVRVRGERLVVCPETNLPVAVKVNVGYAIASTLWDQPELRLTSCSRWPERQDCDQPCVHQIETAPNETSPQVIAADFFGKEHCTICGLPIGAPARTTRQPGFMNPASREVDTWDSLPVQDLPRAMTAWRPLCANCTEAESFREMAPARMTDSERHE